MSEESQLLRAKAIAHHVVSDVNSATMGNPIFMIQVMGIACGMVVSSAMRLGFGEATKDALVKSQTMGLDWQGDPATVLKP